MNDRRPGPESRLRSIAVGGRTGQDIQRAVDSLPSGGLVLLGPGRYVVDETIVLHDGIALIGAGAKHTQIQRSPGARCHILRNARDRRGCRGIEVRDLSLCGNATEFGSRSARERADFMCGAHFRNAHAVVVEGVDVHGVEGSALHFSRCSDVLVLSTRAWSVGWSGVSTTRTDGIVLSRVQVAATGFNGMHSAIHLSGGLDAYIAARVARSCGNGIMLDAKAGPLRKVVVDAEARDSRRGLALFGFETHELSDVLVRGDFSNNRRQGILIWNATGVQVLGATIRRNGICAVALVGNPGARHCTIRDCLVEPARHAVIETGGSCGNRHVSGSAEMPVSSRVSARQWLATEMPFRRRTNGILGIGRRGCLRSKYGHRESASRSPRS